MSLIELLNKLKFTNDSLSNYYSRICDGYQYNFHIKGEIHYNRYDLKSRNFLNPTIFFKSEEECIEFIKTDIQFRKIYRAYKISKL